MDEKLAKILRKWRSTTFPPEKEVARRKAEAMAEREGMTFAEAVAALDVPEHPPNIFAGFDEWMEEREPGHKARKAAERAEQQRRFAHRRDDLVRRFGSLKAAAAPTEAERAIINALAPWRTIGTDGATEAIQGHNDFDPLPDYLAEAIKGAWPWPRTYTEAVAEAQMWSEREDDLNALAGETMEYAFDLAAELRARMIHDLVSHAMPATTAAEVHDRLKRYRAMGSEWHAHMLAAVERDLAALAEADRHVSASVHVPEPTLNDVLRADPTRSDRDIARQIGCSPTTVGKVRARLGLSVEKRSVRRGGQIYEMNSSSRKSASGCFDPKGCLKPRAGSTEQRREASALASD